LVKNFLRVVDRRQRAGLGVVRHGAQGALQFVQPLAGASLGGQKQAAFQRVGVGNVENDIRALLAEVLLHVPLVFAFAFQ